MIKLIKEYKKILDFPATYILCNVLNAPFEQNIATFRYLLIINIS